MRQENYLPTVKVATIAKYKRRRAKRNNHSNTTVLDGLKAPNMSRRIQGTNLCAFPTFDKCDSLVFVPVSMVKMMNCDDFPGVRKLLATHIHRNCIVDFKGEPMTMGQFIDLQEIVCQLHPDKISCVHDTKVVNNTIHASLFTKFTDNKLIYDVIAASHRTKYPGMFAPIARSTRWNKKIPQNFYGAAEKAQLDGLLDSGADLVVYANMEWILTFDIYSRKITRFSYRWTFVEMKDASEPNLAGLGAGNLLSSRAALL